MKAKTLEDYIPLDKSWIIRMGVLDLLHNHKDIITFLDKQPNLNSDLQSLYNSINDWRTNKPIRVGESGTLYRFLQFASWKYNLNKKFIKEGTLATRDMCNDPNIITYSLEKLLKLDNETSQWGSAMALSECDWSYITKLEQKYKIKGKDIPFKLNDTRESIKHWTIKRAQGEVWQPRLDETILNQAKAYIELLQGKRPDFISKQAEDYCFAKVFKYKTEEFESLKGHESNRIKAMQDVLGVDYTKDKIYSDDHRVVQSMAMLIQASNPHWSTEQVKCIFSNPDCVSKSWPLFWNFMNSIKDTYTVKTQI